PVNEAARRVGYDNPSHFSREFKKHFGVSPRDARSAGYMPIDI
ncbi:helix-turn-helix domain-containing protein, partial [Thioclava indica]